HARRMARHVAHAAGQLLTATTIAAATALLLFSHSPSASANAIPSANTSGAIEAVLPISNEVAAVVVDPVDAVNDYIDVLTKGRYMTLVSQWEGSKSSDAKAWKARKTVKKLRR